MLLVKTKLGQSEFLGLGLFAAQDIAEEMPIWEFTPGFDLMLHKDFVDFKLSEEARRQVVHYGWREGDIYFLTADDSRFWNHSTDPNTKAVDFKVGRPKVYEDLGGDRGRCYTLMIVAKRNIKEGEELTCAYDEFDDDYDPAFSTKDNNRM